MVARAFATTPMIEKENGLTVRDLKKLIQTVPEIDNDGNEAMVYVATGNEMADVVTLGKTDEDGDIMLVPGFWHDVMDGLETLGVFLND
jgi:hypothetical protein